jgi:hypothetical protein
MQTHLHIIDRNKITNKIRNKIRKKKKIIIRKNNKKE